MGRTKTLLWDWNGTLLDDVELCYRTINAMLKKRRLKEFASLEEYRRTFCFPVEDYYRLAGFDFDAEPFDVLAVEYMSMYQPASFGCGLRAGVQTLLTRLAEEGIVQIVLSASERGNLMAQAARYRIMSYFQQWLGIDDVFARGKLHVGMRFLEANDIDPATVLLIGDTVHDYEVARAMGCDALLLSGGHQDADRLKGCGCPVVEDAGAILEYIQ